MIDAIRVVAAAEIHQRLLDAEAAAAALFAIAESCYEDARGEDEGGSSLGTASAEKTMAASPGKTLREMVAALSVAPAAETAATVRQGRTSPCV